MVGVYLLLIQFGKPENFIIPGAIFKGKAYCWCVNEKTGAQIPDTVVVNARPNCDRPMKGILIYKVGNFLGVKV